MFESFKSGRARCPQRADALPRAKSCCRTLVVASALCVAAAFVPSFADGLPSGYTQLPYIKANKQVQLKTGYTPATTDKIVMTFCPTQNSTTECLWCARTGSNSQTFSAFAYGTAKIGIHINTSVYEGGSTIPTGFTVNRNDSYAANTKYTVIADGNAKTLVVTNDFTGAEVANYSWTVSNDYTPGSEICLFGSHKGNINSSNNWSTHYLYSFKVYDAAGTLKLNLVPAKDSTGAVGLYDTVGGDFKTRNTSSNGKSGSLTDTLLDMTFSDDFTLLDDEVFGTVTVDSGKTLDLNGHNLTVGGLAGEGSIAGGLLDLTTDDSSRVESTGTFYDGTVGANLFNNNYIRETTNSARRVIVNVNNLPVSVTYDFGEDSPERVDMYKVYVGPLAGYNARAPKSWTLEGSNDKETWTSLDSRDSETGWSRAAEVRTYQFENATQYRYYRITFLASNDTSSGNKWMELVQLENFDTDEDPDVPPELRVSVPEGASSTNSTVSIKGSVRLVKQGGGEFVANMPYQRYLGGTFVEEGTFKAMPSVDLPVGAADTVVRVESGACYDFNGANTSHNYGFVLNGGTIANTGDDFSSTSAQIGGLTLLADSYITAPSSHGLRAQYDAVVNVDLGGHVLDVDDDVTFWIDNATFSNGTARIAAQSIVFITNPSRADTATLDLTGAIALYPDVSASNLVLRSACSSALSDTATGAFKVYGTFKTETADFPFVKMMDGSTLDLTDWEGEFNAVSVGSNVNGYKLSFESGATVTIDISGRSPAVGDCIVAWDEAPTGVTFQFDATTAAGGVSPVVTERGLLYGYLADTVEEAWWTGSAGDGNIANSENWLCKNVVGDTVTGASAVPSSVTHIYLEGTLNISDSTNLASVCRVCTLTNATLAGDCDLRGLGAALEIASGATVNLGGNKLYVSAAAHVGSCTIRDADPVDLTTDDSSRVESTGEYYGSTSGANLFNNNYERDIDSTHRIIVETNNLPVSATYDFGEATLVDAYRIWTGPIKNHSNRNPQRWKIEGSNDGIDWTLLDYRKAVSGYSASNGNRAYSFANSTAYSRYRITFEAAQASAEYLEAVQLEYFGLKATQGELHIDTTGVSGETEYANLSLDGNMRVVKEGAGTIRLSKTNQKHFGGVEILGGTVLVGTSENTAGGYLGVRGSEIVVRGDNSGSASATSGVLDFGGVDGYTSYRIALDGGAVFNAGLANVTDLRLDSDSQIKVTSTTAANGTNYIGRADSPSFVDLRGHTLSATIARGRTLYLYNATLDNGLLDVLEGGWFGTRGDVVATNASLRANCAVDINGTFLLRDYTHLLTKNDVNRGDGVIDVYGTFSTVVRLFHGTLLHDGATIDLATNYTVDAPLPTVARFSSTSATATGDKTLRFEPGATIGVKLGERTVAKGTCVISWDEETAPDSTVKFVPADADRQYRLVSQTDGLYYYPPCGFMMIVR